MNQLKYLLGLGYAILITLFPYLKKPTVSILIFHQIHNLDRFKKLITKLSQEFDFLTIEDLEKYQKNAFKPKKASLLISFDDAFYSQYLATRHVLDPLNIKAIFFVNPPFLDCTQEEASQFITENMKSTTYISCPDATQINMSPDSIRELIKNGHTVGAHTWSHKKLSYPLRADEVQTEIINTNQKLSQITHKSIRHFAIPFGAISAICQENIQILSRHYSFIYSSIRGHVPQNGPIIFRQNIDMRDPIFYCVSLAKGLFINRYKAQRQIIQSWHN